jgi:16S rRNA (adenine1518-N6/adenine1519-N6)-dimethyltransferase
MPRARKRFGQHFLEAAWVDKVVHAIAPDPNHVFLEVGPGHGALTRPLAARAKHVLAFEIDRVLAAALRRRHLPHVSVFDGDFLRVPAATLRDELGAIAGTGQVRVVGNLPYYIGTTILFRLIELQAFEVPLADATVMLQREVARRLTAVPGTHDYGILTVLIGHSATIEPLFELPPGAFRPAPKVHSALLRLHFHPPDPPVKSQPVLSELVRAIFTQRRKTLANALKAFPLSSKLTPAKALDEAGLDPRRRPETLTLPELVRLADTFVGHLDEHGLVADAGAVL